MGRLRRGLQRLWPHSGALSPVPALDGLRALAVLLTIVFHVWFIIPGIHNDTTTYDFAINYGRTGVQLFFVLSGFLLFQPAVRWVLGQGQRPAVGRFYLRRLRRVAPAYWMCLLVFALVMPLTPKRLVEVLLHVVWLQNLSLSAPYAINSVFWTMAVEVQFYLLLPLLALLLHTLVRRYGRRQGVLLFFGLLFLVSALDSVAVQRLPSLLTLPIAGSLLFGLSGLPYWLAVFASGMGLRFLVETRGIQRGTWRGYGMLTGALTLALAIVFLPQLHHIPGRDMLFGSAYAALIYATLSLPWLTRIFAWAPLRFIGLISYSLYLWHWIIIRLLNFLVLDQVPSVALHVLLGSVLAIACSIPLAYLWYQIIERPFLTTRRVARGVHPAAAVEAVEAQVVA